ncbi:type II toxin-antitoxin system RelE/ParE family toxin [Thalassobaculum sp.]|uniref:type II toxin-antitoxin system RelE/ParE family toxin n=1 Tax=Thalassobaculum sp. TaxID=2022740 RepID=UPI0032EFA7E9
MRHKVVVTRRAEDDLEAIGDHVARENRRAAYALISRIRDRIAGLADHPERYRLRPQLGPAYRVLVVDAYVVVYRVAADTVVVMRIFHGARDYRRHL